MFKKIAGFLFSVLVGSLAIASVTFAYQSPGKPTGFVNDFAGVLSADTKNKLEQQLKDYENKESNEISVVTVRSLDGDVIEEYAVKLFEEWKIGKAKQDNGVLLLIAPNEREVRIEVGYGLEGALTDAESKMIIENTLIPAFKANDFDGGVTKAVEAIMQATKGEYTPPTQTQSFGDSRTWSVIFMFIIIFFFRAIFYSMRKAARSKAIWPGALTGGIIGLIIGLVAYHGVIVSLLLYLVGGSLFGLFVDYILSRTKAGDNYRRGGPGGFFGGGFGGGGGSSGGGFGGFGGGSSGGGGASGRW